MRNQVMACCLVLCVVSCNGGGGVSVQADGANLPEEIVILDAGFDQQTAETAPSDLLADASQQDLALADVAPDLGPSCAPGEGCFLDACAENVDCLSGYCVDHLGDAVCSRTCSEDCPDGWSCQQVGGTDPDVVFICVSDYPTLCRPCATGADCQGAGGVEVSCVAYGPETGNFCGGGCEGEGDCPTGFACQEIETAGGGIVKSCVSLAGVCSCSDTAITLGLSTPCVVENDFGACEGQRLCTEAGLSGCSAPEPAGEVCNGLDDDCDEQADEGTCDDENPCTADTCLGEAGCENAPLDGTECMDGNPCTVADHCEAGLCTGDPVNCEDQNPCTDDACDEAGGCKHEHNTAPCDDGDPCTLGDLCLDGACAGTPVSCDCQADEDCAAMDDGDTCNGTLFCDKTAMPYQCKVDPDTVVNCPAPQGPSAWCKETACDPLTGECGFAPAHQGLPCEDGDVCTYGGTCQGGGCVLAGTLNCDDGNPCTNDSCDSNSGCVHEPNEKTCDDGNACTTNDSCSAGACVGGGVLPCGDGNPCTDDHCDPLTGCWSQPNQAACSDGNACTEADTCQGGGCVGVPLSCDDGNPCTDDWCEPAAGCKHAPNSAPCDDNNTCTTGDVCQGGVCQGAGAKDCDDENPCTKDVCTPGGGCQHVNLTGACSDGDPCTLNDFCQDGQCQPGAAPDCDDGNPCTVDSCSETGLCLHEPTDAACDDGNACTTGDHCEGGACVTSGLEDCQDDSPCTTDWCDPGVGCKHSLNEQPCDDGNACTLGDTCSAGDCLGLESLDCDDGNPCTDDSCEPDLGCVNTNNQAACDDGSECTANDQCSGGACSGAAVTCNDDNVCTNDVCNPDTGCVFVHNTSPCNDGDVCTTNDACLNGVCVGGGQFPCSDSNPCTDDSCDPVDGCVFSPNSAGCDDGNECTENDVCVAGGCVAGDPVDCDDQNLCTDDGCDPDTGCTHEDNTNPCDDGDQCTVTDVCGEGDCVGSGAPNCDDGDPCTTDSCEPDQGCVHADITPCCGNNQVEPPEECDDGNYQSGDGCEADCTLPNLYWQTGPQANVPANSLSGWTQCYHDYYHQSGTSLNTIKSQCNKSKILMACRPNGNANFTLLAMGSRTDVFFDVGTADVTHNGNGVGWYFDNQDSWGFVQAGDPVSRNSCDTGSSNAQYRLCWHTGGGAIDHGWRCGSTTDLNSASNWERFVFHAD